MEAAVVNLEQSLKTTDSKLDRLAWKLEEYEREMSDAGATEGGTEVSVLNLLRNISQVREDYERLKQEISEVQTLQRQLSDSLRLQMRQVQERFVMLRQRIVSGGQKPAATN